MALKKLVYIVSYVTKSLAFEWMVKGMKNDYDITFILLNPASSELEDFLRRETITVYRIKYLGKRDFFLAFLRTIILFFSIRPDIVHAHLLDAQLIGLTCAWLTGVKKRIYTRHTSNFHEAYRPAGVKYDRWSNGMATHIISISQATDLTLLQLESVAPAKVIKIWHGFDLKEFQQVDQDRRRKVREKWRIPPAQPVIGVIARHIEWKGVQYILPAFQRFLEKFPNACLVLANATGPYHAAILKSVKELPVDKVVMIPFEEDVIALYQVFDIYVHTPVDSICEAFGQTYVEALASGVPSIFTMSGIAVEFIEDKRNALVVPFRNADAIYDTLITLAQDKELGGKLVENGKRDVNLRFRIEPMLASLRALYDS